MKTKMLLPAFAAGMVLLLGACGGGGGGSSAATTPTTAAASDPSAAAGEQSGGGGAPGGSLSDPAVQQCLADKGITVPSFTPGQGRRGAEGGQTDQGQAPAAGETPGTGQGRGGGIDAETRQAMQDCGVTFGQGRFGAGAGAGAGARGAFNDPAVQQCLADKGITLPQFGGGESSAGSTPSSIDANTRQAIQDCQSAAASASTTTPAG